MNKVLVLVVGSIACALLFGIPRAVGAAEDPALTLFKKNGCNECHSITSLGVKKEEKKAAAPDTVATTADSSAKKKKKPPDLSGVGLRHDAKWISAFLNKQELLDGEKHEKRFKGTEAERRTVAMFLAGLKTETKPAATTEKPETEEKDDD